jgi:hypothetical protein
MRPAFLATSLLSNNRKIDVEPVNESRRNESVSIGN